MLIETILITVILGLLAILLKKPNNNLALAHGGQMPPYLLAELVRAHATIGNAIAQGVRNV